MRNEEGDGTKASLASHSSILTPGLHLCVRSRPIGRSGSEWTKQCFLRQPAVFPLPLREGVGAAAVVPQRGAAVFPLPLREGVGGGLITNDPNVSCGLPWAG